MPNSEHGSKNEGFIKQLKQLMGKISKNDNQLLEGEYAMWEVFDNYKKDVTGLANIFIGIGKYTDFRFPEKIREHSDLINEIARICSDYLIHPCDQYEDGAAVQGTPKRSKIKVRGLPVLAAATFRDYPKKLDTETKIYRIVSDKTKCRGRFWFTHPKISSLTLPNWRSNYAVLRWYTPGTVSPSPEESYYLYEYTTTGNEGWVGPALGQKVPYSPTCILEGGDRQVYLEKPTPKESPEALHISFHQYKNKLSAKW